MVTALAEVWSADEVAVGVARVAVTVTAVSEPLRLPPVGVKTRPIVPAALTAAQPAAALMVQVGLCVALTTVLAGGVTTNMPALALPPSVPCEYTTGADPVVAAGTEIVTVTRVGPVAVLQGRLIDVGLATNVVACIVPAEIASTGNANKIFEKRNRNIR
jgi:hypothetical protein